MSEAMVCPPSHKHGLTLTCYQSHGCRCESCRGRGREYGRAQRGFDPYAVDRAVDGVRVWLTTEQRAEAVHRLWSRRWSDNAIAARIGVTGRTVQRIRQRNGWRGYQKWELEKMKEAA